MLLSNIAYHGLEKCVKQWAFAQPFKHYRGQGQRDKQKSLAVIRSSYDFVVLHRDEHDRKVARTETERMLAKTSKLSLKGIRGKAHQTRFLFPWLVIYELKT